MHPASMVSVSTDTLYDIYEFVAGVLIGTFLSYDLCTLFTNLSDCIGIFPQMILTGFSVIALLLMVISRELDNTRLGQVPQVHRVHYTSSFDPNFLPTDSSCSTEISQDDMYRLSKHFRGQYVYPPALGSHRMCPGGHHYRSTTMSRTMEAGEMSDSID
jgi:hypothetical protein